MATRRTDSARATAGCSSVAALSATKNASGFSRVPESARDVGLNVVMDRSPGMQIAERPARCSVGRAGHHDWRHVLEPALRLHEAFELGRQRARVEVVDDE